MHCVPLVTDMTRCQVLKEALEHSVAMLQGDGAGGGGQFLQVAGIR